MAKSLKPKSGDNITPITGKNDIARGGVITSLFADAFNLDQQIDQAREKYLRPLTDERKEIWRTAKADTDIPRETLDVGYRAYKRARVCQEMEDSDAAERALQDLRDVFLALDPGAELDWVKAIQSSLEV